MQFGEAIAPPMLHADEHPKCPFCPLEEIKSYTTYDGEANNSKYLETNMNNPAKFESGPESGVSPKYTPTSSHIEWLKKPAPIGTHPSAEIGAYSCEAHHLVSGKQALANKNGHKFEQWIKASHGKIEKDTGYSVNNFDNGIWMPSVPENTKGIAGAWGGMDRQEVANYIMKQSRRQFHKGGHSIPETRINSMGKRVKVPDDEAIYTKYDDFLIKKLKTMNERMHGWAAICPQCFEGDVQKEKVQPTQRVNIALDRLGGVVRKQIIGPKRRWTLFISSLAWIYFDENSADKKNEISL
jgi:hypothetical protein